MRAMAIGAFTGIDAVTLMDLPKPMPGPNELLIRTHAAGVGLWDAHCTEGRYVPSDTPLPYIPGFEAAGVVEMVGPGVSAFQPGDEVYTYVWPGGSYAEFTVAPAAQTARKPRSLSFLQAAGIPVAGVTALRGTIDQLGIRPGEVLLVTAAAGGVGSLAVQLAARAGARVIGTASPSNHAYVRSLGAAEVVDYHDAEWVSRVRDASGGGVDAVFDCVGGSTLDASIGAVRDGGRAVYIVPANPPTPQRGIAIDFYEFAIPGEPLARLTELIDAGELRLEVQDVFPLEQTAAALRKVMAGHTRGKIVLDVSGEN